jgi:dolichol-phosphate mannosyltransferase
MQPQMAAGRSGHADRVGAVIPVYGESDAIISVLDTFPTDAVETICLVVDAPTPRLIEGMRAAASRNGITTHIIKNGMRRGVGFCILQGLDYLRETSHTVAVVMAGNGKDDPREITRLIEPVVNDEADYVQGSRYLNGGKYARMPLVRKVFNRSYPKIWALLAGRNCTDVTNGYRCYRLSLLDDARINLRQEWLHGYSFEYYLHFKALTLGFRVKEVPVSKIYPFGHKGGYSKIQPLKDWLPIISPPVWLAFGIRE